MATETEIVAELKPRYKSYLEGAFSHIAPTKAAMEYRIQLLTELLDRTQELSIKGIVDPELIYETAISELGDIDEKLREFEGREQRASELKHKLSAGTAVAISVIALLAIVYVIVSAATGLWHPLWLILLGGVFASAILLMFFASLKLLRKRKILPVRAMLAAGEILVCTFIFLLLQLIFKIDGSWMTFLAMVALIFGADTAVAFLADSKLKWVELPVFIEVLMVMLYVILGIALDPLNHIAKIWHPGWVMCLSGVAVAIVELIAFILKRARARDKREEQKDNELNKNQDEKYWTMWND